MLAALVAASVPACGDDEDEPVVCTHDGQDYMLGDMFPAGDGCNTCSCTEMGVACTIIGCAGGVDAGISAPQ